MSDSLVFAFNPTRDSPIQDYPDITNWCNPQQQVADLAQVAEGDGARGLAEGLLELLERDG